MNAGDLPHSAGPALSGRRPDRGPRPIAEIIREMPELTPKPASWHQVRGEYVSDALSGRDEAFARDNEEACVQMVLRIAALCRVMRAGQITPLTLASQTEQAIRELIERAASDHADRCETNGTLWDIENNPKGSTLR